MKKKLCLLLSVVMILCGIVMAGCGGGGAAEAAPYEGKYVAVVGEAMGIKLDIEKDLGQTMEMELSGNGKLKMAVDDTTGSGKYEVDGDQVTFSIQGEEFAGTIGEDVIIVDDMLGMGLTVYFAKEGTDAMDPANYQ